MAQYNVTSFLFEPHNSVARMFFDLNGDTLQFDRNQDIDLLLWSPEMDYFEIKNHPAKLRICVDLANAESNKIQGWNQVSWLKHAQPNDLVLVECHDPGINNTHLISTNFIFNRTRAYYQQWCFPAGVKKWHWHHELDFVLPSIDANRDRSKIFLTATKNYQNRAFRKELLDFLNQYKKIAHIGHWPEDTLSPNRWHAETTDVESLPAHNIANRKIGYSPVHNSYYLDSYVSIYAETLTSGTTLLVTEKTFDPLIKGHFILPFGTAGLIDQIRKFGFRLPDFIDYSYDLIVDDQQRFQAFCQEVQRCLSWSLEQWKIYLLDNVDILYYNRRVFDKTAYYQIDFEPYMRSL